MIMINNNDGVILLYPNSEREGMEGRFFFLKDRESPPERNTALALNIFSCLPYSAVNASIIMIRLFLGLFLLKNKFVTPKKKKKGGTQNL